MSPLREDIVPTPQPAFLVRAVINDINLIGPNGQLIGGHFKLVLLKLHRKSSPIIVYRNISERENQES
jgi:hypothetical protein